MPKVGRAATAAYKDEQDTLGAFIAETCATGSTDYRVKAGDLILFMASLGWAETCPKVV